MSNLNDSLSGVVGTIFTAEQSALSTAHSDLETWSSTTGNICCTLIMDKLNSEPHVTNICNLFKTSAQYAGISSASPTNRLWINYTIDDTGSPPDIDANDHIALMEMTGNAEREQEVGRQIEEHYSGNLKFPRISYTHTDGNNKKISIRIMKFESA